MSEEYNNLIHGCDEVSTDLRNILNELNQRNRQLADGTPKSYFAQKNLMIRKNIRDINCMIFIFILF
jgi:hypothetical protein